MTRSMQFTLPIMPVPLSACFVNVARNGRADTERYTAWKDQTDAHLAKHASKLIGTPYRPSFSGDVAVTYNVKRPDARKRDLDNLLKALGDSLTRNHVVKDDSQIVDLRIRWASSSCLFDGAVSVSISEIAESAAVAA